MLKAQRTRYGCQNKPVHSIFLLIDGFIKPGAAPATLADNSLFAPESLYSR